MGVGLEQSRGKKGWKSLRLVPDREVQEKVVRNDQDHGPSHSQNEETCILTPEVEVSERHDLGKIKRRLARDLIVELEALLRRRAQDLGIRGRGVRSQTGHGVEI